MSDSIFFQKPEEKDGKHKITKTTIDGTRTIF